MITALQVCGLSVFAEQETADTLRHVDLDEVQVIATRATAHTPIAFVNMDKETIRKQNAGLDVPFLLTMTPSVLTYYGCWFRHRLYHHPGAGDGCYPYQCHGKRHPHE